MHEYASEFASLNKDFEWNLIFVFEPPGSGSGRCVSPERFILHASCTSDLKLSGSRDPAVLWAHAAPVAASDQDLLRDIFDQLKKKKNFLSSKNTKLQR